MWVRSALINRDSQKTDPQIQLLDYLDPSFWGDELRRVQLTTYEGFRALNSDKTRESIKTYSGPTRKTGARSKIQSWGTILGTASHRYPYIKCGRCLANGMFGLLLFSYQSRNCIYSFMLHIICIIQVNSLVFPFLSIFVSLFTELRTSWRCDITSGQDMGRGHQNCILDPRSPPNCVVGLGIVVQWPARGTDWKTDRTSNPLSFYKWEMWIL